MCASYGDPGAGKYLEAPEPMAEVVSSAFSHESMASMLATKGKKCWNGFEKKSLEKVGCAGGCMSYVFLYNVKHVSNMWSIWQGDMNCMLHDHGKARPFKGHFRGSDEFL